MDCPLAGFHSRTVPSASAAARFAVRAERHPVHAASRTGIGKHGSPDRLPGGRVPQPYGAVGVGGGQEFALGAECHSVHAASRTGTGDQGSAHLLAGDRVPQPYSAIGVAVARSLPSGLNATPFTP